MRVYNPTENPVSVTVQSVTYARLADTSFEVPVSAAAELMRRRADGTASPWCTLAVPPSVAGIKPLRHGLEALMDRNGSALW